jgi:WD40 repeat protein
MADLAPALRLTGHAGAVNVVAVAPDGRTLYSGGADATVRAWTLPAEVGETLRVGNQPEGTGARPRVSADGRRLAAPGRDGTILVVTGADQRVLSGHQGPVKEVGFLPDGKQLVSLGQDQTIRLWDLTTGEGRVLHTTRSQAFRLRVSAERVAFTEGFEDLSILSLADGKVVCVFPARSNTGSEMAPDGAHVAFAHEGQVRWGEIATCAARTLYAHEGAIFTIAFTRDSAWIATASGDATVGLAPTGGGEPQILRGHRRGVYAVAFSPDGELLASGDFVGEGRLWRRRDGSLVAKLEGHQKALLFLGWTADGSRIISSGGDDTVRVWDVAGEVVSREQGTGGWGFAVLGQRIVSTGPAGLRTWPIDSRPSPPTDHASRRAWMDEQTRAVIGTSGQVASPP